MNRQEIKRKKPRQYRLIRLEFHLPKPLSEEELQKISNKDCTKEVEVWRYISAANITRQYLKNGGIPLIANNWERRGQTILIPQEQCCHYRYRLEVASSDGTTWKEQPLT